MRKYMQYPICQKNILQILSYIFFIKNKCNMERKHHIHGKIKPDDANTEKKQSLDLFFQTSPNSTCNALARE
jgi:hypothetical protein